MLRKAKHWGQTFGCQIDERDANRRSAGQRGSRGPGAFSLIELVISLGVLSVGLVGAMRVFPVGLRASRRAEQASRATIVAQRTIESLKLKAWDELADGEATAEAEGFDVTTRIGPTSVERLVDPSVLKTVEVRVAWSQDGRPRALAFVTYVRREGP